MSTDSSAGCCTKSLYTTRCRHAVTTLPPRRHHTAAMRHSDSNIYDVIIRKLPLKALRKLLLMANKKRRREDDTDISLLDAPLEVRTTIRTTSAGNILENIQIPLQPATSHARQKKTNQPQPSHPTELEHLHWAHNDVDIQPTDGSQNSTKTRKVVVPGTKYHLNH